MTIFRSIYETLHRSARRAFRTRRGYNLLRRVQLIFSRIFRIPHEPEFRFFAAFRELTGPIVDVGANGGQSVVSFSIFCSRAIILSFEPNPAMHGELSFVFRRLHRNGSRLIPLALGEVDGSAFLNIPLAGTLPLDARASLLSDQHPSSTDGASQASSMQSIEVPLRRFDGLGSETLGTLDAIQVVKIDVEGFEAQVVKGMVETLRRDQPLVLFERSQSLEAVTDELTRLGYRLYDFDPGARELTEIGKGPARLNVFALSPAWQERCRERKLLR